jgi:hypothetical protein
LAKENEARRAKRKEEADQENAAYQQQLADYKQECAERNAQSQAFQDKRSADREAAATRNLERREKITTSRNEVVAAKELAAAANTEAREARLQASKDAQGEAKALAAEIKAAQAEEKAKQLEATTEAMEAEAVEMEAMEAEVEEETTANDGSAVWATKEVSEERSSSSAPPSAPSAPSASIHNDGYPDDGEKVQEMRDAIDLFNALFAEDRKRRKPETKAAYKNMNDLQSWVKNDAREKAKAASSAAVKAGNKARADAKAAEEVVSVPVAKGVHNDGYPDDGERVQEMRDAIDLFNALFAEDRRRKKPETRAAQQNKTNLVRWCKCNLRTYAEAEQDIKDAEAEREHKAEIQARYDAINKQRADDEAAKEAAYEAADAKWRADNDARRKKESDKEEIAHLCGSNGHFTGKDRNRPTGNYILGLAEQYCQDMPGVQVREIEIQILQSIRECGGGYVGFDTYKSTIFKDMMSGKKNAEVLKLAEEKLAKLAPEKDRIVQHVSRSFGGDMVIEVDSSFFDKSEEFLALATAVQAQIRYLAATSMIDHCLTDAFTELWETKSSSVNQGETKSSGGSRRMVGLCGFPAAVEHMKSRFSSIIFRVHPTSDVGERIPQVALAGNVLEIHVNLSFLVEIIQAGQGDANLITQMRESPLYKSEGGIIGFFQGIPKKKLYDGNGGCQAIYAALVGPPPVHLSTPHNRDDGRSWKLQPAATVKRGYSAAMCDEAKKHIGVALETYYNLRHGKKVSATDDPTHVLAKKYFKNIRPQVEVVLAPGLRKVRQKAVIEECNADMAAAAAAASGLPAAEIDWSFLDAGVFATTTEYVTCARNCLTKTVELLWNEASDPRRSNPPRPPYPFCGESLRQLQQVIPELKKAMKKVTKISVAFTNKEPATNLASIGAAAEAIAAKGPKNGKDSLSILTPQRFFFFNFSFSHFLIFSNSRLSYRI